MADDIVLPADDASFSNFKSMCLEEDEWSEVYNKKGVRVCTKSNDSSNIRLIRVCSYKCRYLMPDIGWVKWKKLALAQKLTPFFSFFQDKDYRGYAPHKFN